MLKFLNKYDKVLSVLVLIISIALSIAVFLLPLNPEQLTTYGYGGVFIITMLGAATLFIPGPTMIAAFAVGAMLNPMLVALAAGAGSALGETTGYAAGYASRAVITPKERRDSWYQRIYQWMSSHPFLTIFLLDAIPNLLGDIAGLIAGRNRYSYLKFLLASFLGKSIRFSIAAFLGAGFGHFLFPR